MATQAAQRLETIRAKVERADEHIGDAAKRIAALLATKPYRPVHEIDAQTGKSIWVLRSVPVVPSQIACVCGDAIQNLRSALDHLAQQIWNARNPGRISVPCNFPIAGSPTKYEAMLRGEKEALGADVVAGLLVLEAYKGGNGHELWVLNYLNNIDKHRLILTVGSMYRSVNVGGMIDRAARRDLGAHDPWSAARMPTSNVFFRPAGGLRPLNLGDVLLGGFGEEDVEPDEDFAFDVAFNEPHVMQIRSVVETLKHFSDLVSRTIDSFKGCLG